VTEVRVVRAFAADLRAAEESGRYEVGPPPGYEKPTLLVKTLPWLGRISAWIIWRTPARRLFARHYVSPYTLVVATVRRVTSDNLSLDDATPVPDAPTA
jgi:hypothetical protein